MHYVFVYGTLKRGGRLHSLLAEQEYVGCAETRPHYRLFNCGSYPGLEEAARGRSIQGEVYCVSTPVLKMLDAAEGVDELLYERRRILLMPPHDDLLVEAWFYLQDSSSFPDCGSNWVNATRAR